MGSRHASRRLAVQALYALEMNPETTASEAVAQAWEEAGTGSVDRDFLEALVRGVWEHRGEIDEAIQRFSARWKVRRMDRVDKTVLRLATGELLFWPEIPAAVIIDEGVELAKEFGSPEASAFVNGLLDRIAHEHRQGELGAQGR